MGFWLLFQWRAFHTDIGEYDWSEIDNTVAALASYDKEFVIAIDTVRFGGAFGQTPELPGFMLNETKYGGVRCPGVCGVSEIPAGGGTSTNLHPRLWDDDVINAYLDGIDGINERYASNPLFKGVSLMETSLGVAPDDPWNCVDINNRVLEISQRSISILGRGRVFVGTNFTCSHDGETRNREDINAALADLGVGWDNPDLYADVGRSRWRDSAGMFHSVRDDTTYSVGSGPLRAPQVQDRTQTLEPNITPAKRYEQGCIDTAPHIIVWWIAQYLDLYTQEKYDLINSPDEYPLPCS